MGLPTDLSTMIAVDIGSAPTEGALFPVGKVLVSSRALSEIRSAGEDIRSLVTRHCNGSYGDSSMSEVFENQANLSSGEELGSIFYLAEKYDPDTALCVWTNPDRTESYMLMCEEF
ncbi:hypothetical protein [Armatimonas sp.]|uniref:hypothetical protein n=1 Tax=Armatimonas sp. TaxID=1872638 RepID=UPI00286C0284|nr:hypothetical protein [Armatimonas sp.]